MWATQSYITFIKMVASTWHHVRIYCQNQLFRDFVNFNALTISKSKEDEEEWRDGYWDEYPWQTNFMYDKHVFYQH